MLYSPRRCVIPTSVLPSPKPRRGAVAVFEALLLGTLSLALATATGEWFVNINAPCDSGTGTQTNPFCNIMDAVDVASSGDTIHIAPGNYFENLVLNKDLTLIGSDGALVTTVDGQRSGSVVTLADGAVVDMTGLTLTDGFAFRGGGVYLAKTTPAATLTLTDSTVSGNSSGDGGGIFAYAGAVTLENTTVSGNNATNGGGILTTLGGTLTLTSSTVSGNTATYGTGAGIYTYLGTLDLTDSTVSGNYCYGSGGGFVLWGGSLNLTRSTVSGNTATDSGGIAGFFNASLNLTSSAVTGNTTLFGSGGGITSSGTLSLTNSTVSGNHAVFGIGGGILNQGTSPTVINSILWNNAPDQIYGSATVNRSLVEGGWPGTGNIDDDPLFVDPANGNFSLQATSPCIDAGEPGLSPVGRDLGGNPRFLDGDLDRVMVVDMGAHEFDNVQLTVTGNATPGGTLTFDTSGTPGMLVFLAIASAPSELLVRPFGSLFFDLGSPWWLLPMGTIPSTVSMVVPPTAPTPTPVIFQEFAIGPPLPGGRSPGNFSNPVCLTIE